MVKKVFIGNVNGKEFNNEDEFRKAAAEAIRQGGDKLCVSSYYKEVKCDCENCSGQEEIPVLKEVDIVPRKIKMRAGNLKIYEMPVGFNSIITKITKENLKEISNFIDSELASCAKNKQGFLNKKEALQKDLEDVENNINETDSYINYYKILKSKLPVSDTKENKEENKPKNDGYERVDEILKVFDSFGKFLDATGFLKSK